MASKKHRKQPGTGPPSWLCACGKRAYRTWKHANWDATNQRKRYNRRSREQVYWSRECGGVFHVGSKPKKRRLE